MSPPSSIWNHFASRNFMKQYFYAIILEWSDQVHCLHHHCATVWKGSVIFLPLAWFFHSPAIDVDAAIESRWSEGKWFDWWEKSIQLYVYRTLVLLITIHFVCARMIEAVDVRGVAEDLSVLCRTSSLEWWHMRAAWPEPASSRHPQSWVVFSPAGESLLMHWIDS